MSYWKTAFFSLGVGFCGQLTQNLLDTAYLTKFLSDNLIMLLIALLAINSATLGIVLTKIADLVDEQENADVFLSSRKEMLISVKEQIALIAMAILFLVLLSSHYVVEKVQVKFFLESAVIAVFIYALTILYDISKGILIIVEFDRRSVKNDSC